MATTTSPQFSQLSPASSSEASAQRLRLRARARVRKQQTLARLHREERKIKFVIDSTRKCQDLSDNMVWYGMVWYGIVCMYVLCLYGVMCML